MIYATKKIDNNRHCLMYNIYNKKHLHFFHRFLVAGGVYRLIYCILKPYFLLERIFFVIKRKSNLKYFSIRKFSILFLIRMFYVILCFLIYFYTNIIIMFCKRGKRYFIYFYTKIYVVFISFLYIYLYMYI